MDKNIKYGLCYLFPILGGIIMLIAIRNNDREDEFQIKQSIVWGIALLILGIVLKLMRYFPFIGWVFSICSGAFSILCLVIAILYFTGKTFDMPVLGDLARKM